jgi:hypothetical protein
MPTETNAIRGGIASQFDQFVMEPTGVKIILATKLPEFLV